MEFASRGPNALALAGLGVAVTALTGAGCRRAERPAAAPAAAPSVFALSGRVTDEADRAVPEARILALGPFEDATATASRETRSDFAGRFGFDELPRGRYELLIEAAGLASIQSPPLEVPGASPVIRLSGQGRSISGSVVLRGAPARVPRPPGARLRRHSTTPL